MPVTAVDLFRTGQADHLANLGTAEHTHLEPDVRLPPEVPEETLEVGIIGMVYREAPFLIGPHQRVLRHKTYFECPDCGRQTGKVKGEHNFSYLKRQECPKLEEQSTASGPSPFLTVRDSGGTGSAYFL
eukprot:2891083-Amphidinium_carterae.1